MIRIRPFRALHYDAAAVGDLAAVIAPPYDVIDDRQLDHLYERSPYNAVRLILNRSPDRYAAAAAELGEWRARGVLARDERPCLYYYVQDFALPGGVRRQRAGLMAAVHLESFAGGNIRPHERTFARAKEDRLKLLAACRANLSPIFGVYPDRLRALEPARRQSAEEAPWIDVRDEVGDRHRVWRIADPSRVDRIGQALSDRTVFIADGHHRYETALAYRERLRERGDTEPEAPHDYVLMYLTSTDEPGLVLLPTHRVWRGEAKDWLAVVGEHFRVEDFPATLEGERALLARLAGETARGVLALRLPDRACLLRLQDERLVDEALAELHPVVRWLDVTVLDGLVLRRLLGIDCTRAAQEGELTYTHDDAQALRAAAREGAGAAFLLRAPRIEEVESACMAGQVMPEKSTYFYPKLQTGLVFHLLDA
jgi:uncharacterized protein (DUF1015 family)